MPIGNSDFARDFAIGANIGNMRVMQQERMMQLKAQAAQQAVLERQSAAQAQMLMERARLFRAQADQEEQQKKDEAAFSKSFALQHIVNVEHDGLTEKESMEQLVPMALAINPVYGEKLAKGFGEYQKAIGSGDSFAPSITAVSNPVTGDKVPVLRTGPNAYQMVEPKVAEVSPTERERDDYAKLNEAKENLDLLIKSNPGRPELARAKREVERKIEAWQVQHNAFQETIETTTTPGGDTTTRLIRGKPPTPATMEKSTKGELEKKMESSLNSLSLIKEAMAGINASTVGPAGIVNEQLETVRSWAKPGSSTDVTKARQAMRVTAQQLYSSLKADSQVNKLEAEAMKDIADITKVNISTDTGQQKYQTLMDLIGLQVALRSKELKVPVPDKALQGMSSASAARFWKRGDLSDKDVERWNELNKVVQ